VRPEATVHHCHGGGDFRMAKKAAKKKATKKAGKKKAAKKKK
jgi:hypothetical protein